MQPNSLVLATRSRDKVREIRDILAPFPHGQALQVMTLDDAGVARDADEDVIEAFDTFLANAHAKAAYFLRITGRPTIADDSGISIDALGGAPGVRSRRFAARSGLDGLELDAANNERVLRELENIDEPARTAHYTCAAVVHHPNGHRFASIGTCSGVIVREPRGSGGFGYDPLFLVPSEGLTFGEMTHEAKHRHSHRGRAFRALAGVLTVDHTRSFR